MDACEAFNRSINLNANEPQVQYLNQTFQKSHKHHQLRAHSQPYTWELSLCWALSWLGWSNSCMMLIIRVVNDKNSNNDACPQVWCSLGVLYYAFGQYKEALGELLIVYHHISVHHSLLIYSLYLWEYYKLRLHYRDDCQSFETR